MASRGGGHSGISVVWVLPGKRLCKRGRKLGAAYDVGGVQSLGALLTLELDRFPFVQCLISRVLNRGEVHKYIFAGGPLNKPITFGSVEPLDYATLFHRNSFLYMCHCQPVCRLKTPKAAVIAQGAQTSAAHFAFWRTQKDIANQNIKNGLPNTDFY
jgi:hypothetical protein